MQARWHSPKRNPSDTLSTTTLGNCRAKCCSAVTSKLAATAATAGLAVATAGLAVATAGPTATRDAGTAVRSAELVVE